ncbi:MAG TPA: serine hydrolase domain-containing protein [Acidimicrobiia bacterium]|jgi:CubicO group peptidase (beta-lactamase class C family)
MSKSEDTTVVAGWTAPGFEHVRDKFAQNFEEGLEVGAAFAAYRDGEPVVDLWGGIADRSTGRAWTRDTIVLVFSTTKGATAVCANRLAQDGVLDVDAPVVEHWPEFGAAGKSAVPMSDLLSHQAGLPWVDAPMTLEDALAWEPLVRALEQQAPVWEPGTAHGYHAVTYGHLVGEVVRRVTGKTLGTVFAEEVAAPLALDFWIGLPEEQEPRVAPLIGRVIGEGSGGGQTLTELAGPESTLTRALTVGGAFGGRGVFNSRAVRAAEVPAANGVGDARSVARMYAACIGEVDGVRLLSDEQLGDARRQRTSGPDRILLDLDLQWGLGFLVPSSLVQLGHGPHAFGHFGMGGSLGWADPDAGLAFGYVMNKMSLGMAGDARGYRLVKAVYDSLP